MMKTTKTQPQQDPRTTSDNRDWPRPRGFSAAATTPAKSAAFGYPSVRRPDAPPTPTDAERMAEDVERWDGLS